MYIYTCVKPLGQLLHARAQMLLSQQFPLLAVLQLCQCCSISATPTLKSNAIAESAEFLGMLREVELLYCTVCARVCKQEIQSKNRSV